jgi:hypothetical protein
MLRAFNDEKACFFLSFIDSYRKLSKGKVNKMKKHNKNNVVSKTAGEALIRAREGKSHYNDSKIISYFTAKGIAPADIKPRENCLTFKAWNALGKVVKKGEHGAKCLVFSKDNAGKTRVFVTVVFHESQVEQLTAKVKTAPVAKQEDVKAQIAQLQHALTALMAQVQ